jgi:hypothetical protein
MRKKMSDVYKARDQSETDRIATIHDMRFVIFDNDTMLFFASTFDSDWDAYINDFATIVPDEIDLQFGEVEGCSKRSDQLQSKRSAIL